MTLTNFMIIYIPTVVIFAALLHRANKKLADSWDFFLKLNHEANEVIDYTTGFAEALVECLVAQGKITNPKDVFDDEERDASMADVRRAYRRLLKVSVKSPSILNEHLPESNMFMANIRALYDKEFGKTNPVP